VRIRPLLIITAIVSSLLGAVVAYLVLTVPNDVKAGALMKEARRNIEHGDGDKARQSLGRVVQQYPRTDAAAAATVALSTLEAQDRKRLVLRIDTLQATVDGQTKQLAALGSKVAEAAAAPPPAPPSPAVVAAPPPAPPPAPAAAKKKTPTHRSRHRRKR
jgi:hypothetical protein